MRSYNIAIVGATGAVGLEVIRLLEQRNFPVGNLKLLARSHNGRSLKFRQSDIPVEALNDGSFEDCQIAIFSAGSDTSRKFASAAVQAGCRVIDNSSAFRMDSDVPLVVPEINRDALHQCPRGGVIANPNCTTAITLMALWPLHRRLGVKRIIASSYQAVSGSGQKGIEELDQQVSAKLAGQAMQRDVYFHQIAFNVIPQIGSFLESGYTDEEVKLQNEGRKIMNHPTFVASVTCVRVPIYRSHSVAVTAEFEEPVDADSAVSILRCARGLKVFESKNYPTPLDVAGQDDCYVGRVRKDNAFDNGLSFWVVGDQLLKGAALNAVQIAEELVK